jgi:lysophospholipase L1-like esterase
MSAAQFLRIAAGGALGACFAASAISQTTGQIPSQAVPQAAAPAAAQANRQVPAADPRIVRMGRTVETPEGMLRFAYPGVRLSFTFSGTSLSFDAWSSGSQSYLEAVLDGGAPVRIKIGRERQRHALIEADRPGQHTIEIMHRAETWHGVVTLAGFQSDGVLGAGAPLPQRRMLVLGDSVTCAEGVDRGSGTKDSAWTDPRRSYGMLAAAALQAQVHLVCYGGRGLVRSWDKRTDEYNLPDFYELAIADADQPMRWDHRQYQPDLIVSAIGTNDFSPGVPEREPYVATYVRFVRTLLRNHPRARIVLTEGAILNGPAKDSMRAYLAETVQRVGDPRVTTVPSTHYPGDASDAHPTGPQHAEMAREWVPRLKQLMAW